MNLTKNRVLFLFIIFSFLVLTNSGCSRKIQETSVIQLSFGSGGFSKISEFKYSEPMSMQSASAQSEEDGEGAEWNPAHNPTTMGAAGLSQFNCYMIAVSGPEADMQRNMCVTTTGQNLKIGRWHGGIPIGASLSLEVPSGPQREITVIAFKATNGACTNFKNAEVNGMNLSEPHVIGRIVKDLTPGAVAVTIPTTLSATTLKIDDCNGPDFNMEHAPLYFGDKTPAAGSVNITANTSYIPQGGASQNVWGFDPQPTVIPANPLLSQTTFVEFQPPVHANFEVDDEVMLINQGMNGMWTHSVNGMNQVSPCGYRAWEGRYAFARIVGRKTDAPPYGIYVSKGTFIDKLDYDPIARNRDPALMTSITARMRASQVSPTHFCRIKAAKVLHYYDLNISPAYGISADLFAFGPGTAGILPIRVSGTLTMSAGSYINASGKGYQGYANADGSGIRGMTSSCDGSGSNRTGNGGVCVQSGPDGGGGGGHGTASYPAHDPSGGAGGGILPILGGHGVGEDCGDGSCFGELTHKIFMGGAGGASSSASGGHGGGIIYLMARNINLPGGNAFIKAYGADGANSPSASIGSGGGGAGGSILLGYQNLQNGANLQIQAYGGNSGTASYTPSSSGGGGAGGRVHVIGCNSSPTPMSLIPSSINKEAGAAGTATDIQGTIGSTGSIVTKEVPCN